MNKQILEKVQRACAKCQGYLVYWMEGTRSDLYHCEDCGIVHRWDGVELKAHEGWEVIHQTTAH